MTPLLIPILAGAGASLLPILLAALAGSLALLTRPRDLWRAIRSRPAIAAAIAGILLIAIAAVPLTRTWKRTPSRDEAARPAPAPQTDWAAVALEIIRAEREAAAAPPLPATPEGEEPAAPVAPVAPGKGAPGRPVPMRPARPVRPSTPQRPAPAATPPKPAPARPAGAVFTGNLQRLWRYTEPDALVLSTPAAAGGRVYGATCLIEPEGSLGTIFCVDAATGREIWRVDRAGGRELKGFYSSPALSPDGRRLVIGQGLHNDRGCAVVCLDTATGRVLWTAPTSLHVEGTPAISGNMVIAGAGAIEGPDGKPQGDPGYVFAVRLSDGKPVWRYPLPDPESSPAIAGGIVYIGSGLGGSAVAALRTESDAALKKAGRSRLVWKTPTPYPALAPVTVAKDLALIGTGNGDLVNAAPDPAGAVLALDRRTGKMRWSRTMPDAVLGGITVSGNIAYCAVRNGEVVALSLADGRILWRTRPGGSEPILATPTVAGGLVCAVSRDGNLYLMDAKTGRLREKHYLNAADRPGDQGLSVGSALIDRTRLYVGSETGGLSGFGPRAVRPRPASRPRPAVASRPNDRRR